MIQKIASSPTFQYLHLIPAKTRLIFARPRTKNLKEEWQAPVAHLNAAGEAAAVVAIYSSYTTHQLYLSTLSKATERSGGICINVLLASMT